MNVFLQIPAAVDVRINKMDVVLKTELCSLLHNPPADTAVVLSVEEVEQGSGEKVYGQKSSTHMLLLICRRGEASPLMTDIRRM